MDVSLIVARIFVILGAGIIISALFPIRRLIERLPPGRVRLSWYLLFVLSMFFVVGYIAYGFAFLANNRVNVDLIVPSIFFSGSIFVLLLSMLSLQTVIDVLKVTMLEQENVTDSLTGIYNRRYMDRRLYEEFARAERYQQPLSILLIDLDNFKAVNDAYGHQAGDQALISFTRMMMDTIRGADITARYDGDAFMVIATNTTPPDAYQLAERIRKRAESDVLEMVDEAKKHYTVRVTVSIGVSSYYEKFDSVQAFVASADQVMYQAKNNGRNCIVVCDLGSATQEENRPKEINLTL